MSHTPDLSSLPRIDVLLEGAADLVRRFGRHRVVEALRRAVDTARQEALAGAALPSDSALLAAAARDLATGSPAPLRKVINATGVIVHTNLGRAPLSPAARAAAETAAGSCDLEADLISGERSSRTARLDPLLTDLTGAEAAFAVNNCAAALVLALAALSAGRDVLVSRGELVEIGGSFRLPDILVASGARLREVGTTNRTRLADYATAAGPQTGMILKVHPSNYRVTGFVQEASLPELAGLARGRGLPLVHDVGSGLLAPVPDPALAEEPSVAGSLAAGADLVTCSGDKLLGGPQAGLLLGSADLVGRCRSHPLARALRLDKLRIAALHATLDAFAREAAAEVPVWAMLRADADVLRRRCTDLAARLGATVTSGVSVVGGGAAPGAQLPGPVVRVDVPHADAVAAALRTGDPPVVARVEHGAVWIDLRTVPPDVDAIVAARLLDVRAAGTER